MGPEAVVVGNSDIWQVTTASQNLEETTEQNKYLFYWTQILALPVFDWHHKLWFLPTDKCQQPKIRHAICHKLYTDKMSKYFFTQKKA